jgi:hypothetical protein
MTIPLKDLKVDLRHMPGYFWWGLGLEAAGAAGYVFCRPDVPIASVAFLLVFALGFVLCSTGFFAAKRKQGALASENSGQGRSEEAPRRAPVLGGFLVVFGLAALALSFFFNDKSAILPVGVLAVISIILGLLYYRNKDLPARTFSATSDRDPASLRAGVHIKYIIEILFTGAWTALAILVATSTLFPRSEDNDGLADRLWWVIGAIVFGLVTLNNIRRYIWHCWIKRDYAERTSSDE